MSRLRFVEQGVIDWEADFSNRPRISGRLEKIPAGEWLYEKRRIPETESWVYLAEARGQVHWLVYSGPRPGERGMNFGGQTFTLPMKDGTVEDLVGPGAGRPGVVHMAGFPYVVQVGGQGVLLSELTADVMDGFTVPDFVPPEYYRRWNGEPVRFPQGTRARLQRVFSDGEVTYEPVALLPDGTVWRKPDAHVSDIYDEVLP
jgi:endogenous inhibitor of DNA gyrase (YacG/DUF329 family)